MTTPYQMPRVHAVSDVAEMFGRAPRTIRSWIARGLLTPIRVGKAVFIPQEQIDALLTPASVHTSSPAREPTIDHAFSQQAAADKSTL